MLRQSERSFAASARSRASARTYGSQALPAGAARAAAQAAGFAPAGQKLWALEVRAAVAAKLRVAGRSERIDLPASKVLGSVRLRAAEERGS